MADDLFPKSKLLSVESLDLFKLYLPNIHTFVDRIIEENIFQHVYNELEYILYKLGLSVCKDNERIEELLKKFFISEEYTTFYCNDLLGNYEGIFLSLITKYFYKFTELQKKCVKFQLECYNLDHDLYNDITITKEDKKYFSNFHTSDPPQSYLLELDEINIQRYCFEYIKWIIELSFVMQINDTNLRSKDNRNKFWHPIYNKEYNMDYLNDYTTIKGLYLDNEQKEILKDIMPYFKSNICHPSQCLSWECRICIIKTIFDFDGRFDIEVYEKLLNEK